MKTVWKFELGTEDIKTISIPFGAKILTVQEQHSKVCLWALVNPDSIQNENRIIETFGTGHPMNNDQRLYIGTYQLFGGDLVFHVFEKIT